MAGRCCWIARPFPCGRVASGASRILRLHPHGDAGRGRSVQPGRRRRGGEGDPGHFASDPGRPEICTIGAGRRPVLPPRRILLSFWPPSLMRRSASGESRPPLARPDGTSGLGRKPSVGSLRATVCSLPHSRRSGHAARLAAIDPLQTLMSRGERSAVERIADTHHVHGLHTAPEIESSGHGARSAQGLRG